MTVLSKIKFLLPAALCFLLIVLACCSKSADKNGSRGTLPKASFTDTYNFFIDKYPGLKDENHVFQTAEFSQIYNYFLGGKYIGNESFFSGERTASGSGSGKYRVDVKNGNHIFLIGGSWSAEIQAAIGSINDVAKEYGIPAIYNFDPHLDGRANSKIDIFAPVENSPKNGETKEEFTYRKRYRERGDALAKALYHWDGATDASYGDINGDVAENKWTADDISNFAIYIWNKDGANNNPVKAKFTWTAAEAQSEDTFKDSLRRLFDTISVNKQAENVVNVSPAAYFIENEQHRFKEWFTSSTQFLSVDGKPLYLDNNGKITVTVTDTKYQYNFLNLFTQKDTYTPFEIVTYEELRGLLASKGNYAVVIVGQWCPNGFSSLRSIHDFALKYNLQKVYFFDPELDATFNNGVAAIRNSDRTLVTGLYIDLFEDVFTNFGLGKEFESRFDDAYRNYIASENQRRAEASQPQLTDEEKLQIRYTNEGDAGDGLSIYEKQKGYGSYATIDGIGRDAGTAANGRKPAANARAASRIQTPAFILFNKDHKNAQGQPAPVISVFEELWFSGGNMAAPGTFGYAASTKGRIFEQQEYWYSKIEKRPDPSDSSKTINVLTGYGTPTINGVLTFTGTSPDSLHNTGGYNYNTSNNAATPLTSHEEYRINNGGGNYDARKEYTPVVTRTYWPGFYEVLNTFGLSVLDELTAYASELKEADYDSKSFAVLISALTEAKKVASDVKASNASAKAADTAKLNAPKGWTKLSDTASVARLSSTEQIGSYEDLSAAINTVYAALESARDGLVLKGN